MTTTSIANVSVTTCNVCFDGNASATASHRPMAPKSLVGVVLPSTLTFNTGAPEIMECDGPVH